MFFEFTPGVILTFPILDYFWCVLSQEAGQQVSERLVILKKHTTVPVCSF